MKKLNDTKLDFKHKFKAKRKEKIKTYAMSYKDMFKTSFEKVNIIKGSFQKLSNTEDMTKLNLNEFNSKSFRKKKNEQNSANDFSISNKFLTDSNFKKTGFTKNLALEKYMVGKSDDTNYTLKAISEFLEKKGPLGNNLIEIMNSIEDLDTLEKNLKGKLTNIKKEEMNRLFKEFVTNDYQRRYKVDRAIVISALVGEDNTMQELLKISREEKVSIFHNNLDLH